MSRAPATVCVVVHEHRPKPLRYVWHHILPQACGGLTTVENTTSVCDNCHYAVHWLMWGLAHGEARPRDVSPGQWKLAVQGFQAAVAAGTVDKIPDEGGTTAGG